MNTNFEARIEQAKKKLQEADYILVGGGAGLSDAAGIHFSGERFESHFQPFIQKYGFTDLYSSGFYPFETEEERWAYWAKHISLNRYETGSTKLYEDLYKLLGSKQVFVLSTNVESQFEKAGFPANKVFEIQGNYGYIQCAKGCHHTLYPNEQLIERMVAATTDCKVPSELVPVCPVCNGPMDVNLRINQYFVQDERWNSLNRQYTQFLEQSKGKKVVYLELGVGFNTPGIIRYPFERHTYENEQAILIRLNRDHPEGVEENVEHTIAFQEDMQQVITALMQA